ncbi:hypothetical protein ACFQH9_04090 [Pseudonocardia lutea]|uniref:Helix-turn-helix protein n=1 Tax=Pseudonocardia lutea TaxID=2172015 RepID=A0ABW1I3Z6_9PSEU
MPRIAYVGDHGQTAASRRLDLSHRQRQVVRGGRDRPGYAAVGHIGHDDGRAGPGQAQGVRPALSAGAARDQGAAAGQLGRGIG